MGRKTLFNKLSERADWKDIVKKVVISPNPVKYVQDTFSVSNGTANRFMIDLEADSLKGKGGKKKEIQEEDDLNVKKAKGFIYRLEYDIQHIKSLSTFIKFGDELDKLGINVLKEVFKLLHGKEANRQYKSLLVHACKYMIQCKYWRDVRESEEPTEAIKVERDKAIRNCMGEQS